MDRVLYFKMSNADRSLISLLKSQGYLFTFVNMPCLSQGKCVTHKDLKNFLTILVLEEFIN